MIISKFMDHTRVPISKAPKGTMYKIFSVTCGVISNGNNAVIIVPYAMEDEATTLDVTAANAWAVFPTDTVGFFHLANFQLGEQTKWFSVAPSNDVTSFQAVVIFHGELVKASRQELLIEWFRKGR